MTADKAKSAQETEKPKERRRVGDRRAGIHYTVIAEKTLYDVLGEVWRARFIMAGFALLAAALAFLFIAVSQDFYRAQMIIAPANPIGFMPVRSSVAGMEGTLSSGSSYAAEHTDAFDVFGTIYSGTTVASFLAQDKNFIEPLQNDRRFVFSKTREKWDAQSLSEYLNRRVQLDPLSGDSSLRRLSYAHPDKKFAAELLTRLHRITDEMIRSRILAQTNQRIKYLEDALAGTSNPDHKRSLASLLMEQERQKMMVSLDQPYSADIVEPAFVLSRTHWPDPYIIYPVFVFLGLVFGYIVAVQTGRK